MSHQVQAPPAATASCRHTMAVISSVQFVAGFSAILNIALALRFAVSTDLSRSQITLLQVFFSSTFLLFSMPAARIMSRIGCRRTVVLGLSAMCGGAVLLMPAGSPPLYSRLLGGLLLLTCGIILLQVSANLCVVTLGPARKSPSRLNLVQGFFSLGAVAGLVISRAASGSESTERLLNLIAAVILGLLAVAAARLRFSPVREIEQLDSQAKDDGISVWRLRPLLPAAAAIFCGVGAEAAIGIFLVSYFMQPEIAGMTRQAAAGYVPLYLAGIVAGRFAGASLLRKVPAGRAVGGAAVAACLLVTVSIAYTGRLAMWSILFAGTFSSIMFPSIYTLGIAGLGRLAAAGSGFLISALAGGAIIPMSQGALADRIGLHAALVLPAACYLFVMLYGFTGSQPAGKPRGWRERRKLA